MSEKKNISGMFGHHEDENKPEPEIRGGNRPADFISSKGNREPSKETHSLVDEDFEEAVQADCDDYDEEPE